MPNTSKKPAPEVVLREFPPIGKYRVRLVQNTRTGKSAVDIREYVSLEGGFEGFTRRGIRLGERAQVAQLKEALHQILDGKEGPLLL